MEFVSATSKEEALDRLDRFGPDLQVIAGGTDVMVQLAMKQLAPKVLLHVERIPNLDQISTADSIAIGGLTTQRMLAESGLVAARFPALRKAASLSGGWQTQSVGTIAGNVCNASPAADLTPVLFAHDAVVLLESKSRGERRVPITEFVVGRRKTIREPDELVTSFELAIPSLGSADAFEKVGRRGAMEISIANLALRITFSNCGMVTDARIAVGSVGAVAYRAVEAETLLINEHLSPNLIAEAAQLVISRASPIDDVRGTREYRLRVLPRIFEHSLRQCAARAQAERMN
ncbi:FAD binding domain-containing protein [Aminobacter niigataensis]|uniref:FAD binding domain-containing protein n=1 Tax=Aminobacter niigataensis TaxID=83265 RepID=UPI0024C5E051|nr:FAD binding domain-containing protein [Aminobacter niigataensis]CAI2931844.1 FAD-binding PCMH-type domain-containing protein [Aminobacter niigataensis]